MSNSVAAQMRSPRAETFLVLFLAGMFVLHLLLLWDLRGPLSKGYADFTIFYSAAKIIREGPRAELYNEKTQFQAQQEFAPEVRIRQGALPYNHPPFEALIFVPFSWLPYFDAYLVWNLVNLLILCAVPVLLRSSIALLKGRSALFWCFTALAFFPVFFTCVQGQDSILLLLVFASVYIALKKNADLAAGALLALGLFRFHMVLPLALIFLLRRKGNALLGFATVAGALLLISAGMVGWRTLLYYPGYVWRLETIMGHGAIVPADMPTLHGFLANLAGPYLGKMAQDGIVALVSVLLCFLAAARWPEAGDPAGFDLWFSLVLMITVLVSYHAYAHDLSFLLLAVWLAANYLRNAVPAGVWRTCRLLGPIVILYFSPLYMVLRFRYGQLNWLALILLGWAWAAWQEISKRSASERAESGSL